MAGRRSHQARPEQSGSAEKTEGRFSIVSLQVDLVPDVFAYLAVKVGKGADDLADANDDQRGKAWWYDELVERRHQMALNVQAQLRSVQEWKTNVVASAEHENVGRGHRAILETNN